MQTVNISEFRANLLKYLELANSGEIISVTSKGRLLATINPPQNQQAIAKRQLASLSQTAVIRDVISPTGSEWEVSE